jgi:hypothetical protein
MPALRAQDGLLGIRTAKEHTADGLERKQEVAPGMSQVRQGVQRADDPFDHHKAGARAGGRDVQMTDKILLACESGRKGGRFCGMLTPRNVVFLAADGDSKDAFDEAGDGGAACEAIFEGLPGKCWPRSGGLWVWVGDIGSPEAGAWRPPTAAELTALFVAQDSRPYNWESEAEWRKNIDELMAENGIAASERWILEGGC